jgi:[ribosomal protein S18]-alanine N-acetyltransferase
VIIRTAKTDDIAALATIHAQCFDAPWDAQTLTPFVDANQISVAGDPVMGFLIVSEVLDEAEIITIAVATDHRQKGIARALLTAAIARLHQAGICRLFLEVGDDNANAKHLYGGLGFTQIGCRKAYYARKNGAYVDALVLSRAI